MGSPASAVAGLLSWLGNSKAKEMKLARIALLIAVFCLIAIAVQQYVLRQRVAASNEAAQAAVTASFGSLIDAMTLLSSDPSETGKKAAAELKATLVSLSLVVVSGRPDMGSLNAQSFAGLCKLIARADSLFPTAQGDQIDQRLNALLNSQLNAMQASVRNESTARSLRPGDRHVCELQGLSVKKTPQ
jgi:hypothetical protein